MLSVCITCMVNQAQSADNPTQSAANIAAASSATPTPAAETPGSDNGNNPGSAADRILPLEIVVNGTKSGTWLLLERNGIMYAPDDAFAEWRIHLPTDAKPIDFKLNDQSYWPLSAIPGYRIKLDLANQSAELLFSPQAFAATRLVQEKSKNPVASPVLPSVFLNYDMNYSANSFQNTPTEKNLGVLAEVGVSNSLGVLTSSHVGHNLTNAAANTEYSRHWLRLETNYTKDFPQQNRTLRLGDSSTRADLWGRGIYFGGIQYGSNFALTPGFVSQPIPAVSGFSAAPSTVEMYVNGLLRQVSSVPTGPFVVDNFPLLTANGDVRMVVRDILGRETIIEQAFFTSTQLLATGLDDWGIEAGAVRRDLGIASNAYSPGFAAGTWRHGYSDALTLEGRAEATSQMRTAGGGVIAALPGQTLGKAILALSNGQNQSGTFWSLGLERQRLRSNVSLQAQGATLNFRQLGQAATTAPVKLQVAGNWSYSTEKLGTFGMGLAGLNRFDNTRISTVSGNYATRIGRQSNLSFTASRAIAGVSGTSVGMFFVMPLDNNRIVSASASARSGQQDYYVSAMQNPAPGESLGLRALVGRQQNLARAESGLFYTGRYGKVSGDASTSPGQQALRLGASGGLLLADKHLFATERSNQSFALAEVAGYGNVGIGLGSNVLNHTDANGVALIPRLMPYQNNSVRLNPSDLPMSAEIDSIEQIAVPAWRSGVKVVFPVRAGRGALLKILLDDGAPVPAGAVVQIKGDAAEFYVARRGEAFVTGLQSESRLTLKWDNQQCQLDVTLPPESPDEIPRLGPYTCTGVKR